MTSQPPGRPIAEPDPVRNLVEIFLGGAVTLFAELCLILVPDHLRDFVFAGFFVVGALLGISERLRWFGIGAMIAVLLPVIYIHAYVK